MKDNIIVCPHCDKQFIYNRVNGVALVEATQDIQSRQRVHAKLTLDALDKYKEDGVPFVMARKLLLDALNDFARDVHTIMGFGNEVE